MEAKIKEVYDYFKSKILSKDFKIEEMSEYTFTIIIDGKYKFTIWVANLHIPESRRLYDNGYNFMMIEFTLKEKYKLNRILKDDIKNFHNKVTLPQKMADFNRLKKELNIN